MTALFPFLMIAGCYGLGLAVHRYSQRHGRAMDAYRLPSFGDDSVATWSRELQCTALRVIPGGRDGA